MTHSDAHTKLIRSLMRPYESPHHAVVAFWLQDGEVTYFQSGPQISDAPPEDWIFEIASITKVFTAILLCRLIEEGKIDPKAPVREMSNVLTDVPDWVTPERLTAHISGLPNYYMPLWKAAFRKTPDGPSQISLATICSCGFGNAAIARTQRCIARCSQGSPWCARAALPRPRITRSVPDFGSSKAAQTEATLQKWRRPASGLSSRRSSAAHRSASSSRAWCPMTFPSRQALRSWAR